MSCDVTEGAECSQVWGRLSLQTSFFLALERLEETESPADAFWVERWHSIQRPTPLCIYGCEYLLWSLDLPKQMVDVASRPIDQCVKWSLQKVFEEFTARHRRSRHRFLLLVSVYAATKNVLMNMLLLGWNGLIAVCARCSSSDIITLYIPVNVGLFLVFYDINPAYYNTEPLFRTVLNVFKYCILCTQQHSLHSFWSNCLFTHLLHSAFKSTRILFDQL